MGANIGQSIFNVAALVVSYYFSPIAGALVSSAGQALFPAGADVKGPRAQDQGFTSSQVGLDIPLVIGTQKVTGNVIWAADIVEHKKKESAKGSQPKAISYSYTRSFSVMLCDGPIAGVRIVWRNGVVVYDRRPQGDDETDADYRERDAANTKFEQRLRVYLGTEDQLPDPLQEADKGVGKVPAYRGKAYITLENEDITDMGGRVPNFEFEVVEVGTTLTDADPEYRQEQLAPWVKSIDPRNCKNDHEYRYNAGTWRSTLGEALADAEAAEGYSIPAENYYGWDIVTDDVYPFFDLEPAEREILRFHFNKFYIGEDARYGALGPPCGDGVLCCELNPFADAGQPLWWTGRNSFGHTSGSPAGPAVYFFGAGGSTYGNNCFGYPGYPSYSVSLEYDVRIDVRRKTKAPGTICNPLCADGWPLLPEDSRFCILDDGSLSFAGPLQKSTSTTSWKILVDPLPFEAPDFSLAHLPAIPDWDDRYSDQAFWEAAAAAAIEKGIEIPYGPVYPKPIYGVDYPVTKGPVTWKVLQKYTTDSTSVTKYPLGPAIPSFDSRYSDSTFWTNAYTSAKAAYGTVWPAGIEDGLTYNSDYPVTQTYAYARVPPDIRALYADDVTLAHAVSQLSGRCGLSDEQIDVSELTETLHGIRVASNSSGRSIIQQLQQFGFFDAVEVDGLLKFPLRGKDAVATLGEDDLGAHTPGEDTPPLLALERAEPAELPKQINVHFDDVDNEYQSGSMSGVWLTDDASSSADVTLSIAMDSAKAQRIADVLITEAWITRETAKLLIMPNWLKLAAGDAIMVPIEGRTERVRIIDTDMPLPAGAVSANAVRDDQSTYTSYKTGAPVVRVPPRPGVIGPTLLTVLDIPALREADDDAGFYVALRGAMSGWKGATLQISTDGQATWNTVTDVTLGAIVGTASTALPAGPTAIFDRGNQLVVTLPSTAELQSITEDQVLNYGNAAAYGADGRWEILQFAAATNNGDGTWTLSTLLRGRKGTEWAVGLHQAGDSFVLLGDGLVRVALSSASIGKIISLRAISIDLVGDAGIGADVTPAGVALECYSPAHLQISDDGNGNVYGSWLRRTRISGEWLDYADVPLNEASERYKAKLLDGDGNIVQEIEVAEPTLFLSPAQQAVDSTTEQTSYVDGVIIDDGSSLYSAASTFLNKFSHTSPFGSVDNVDLCPSDPIDSRDQCLSITASSSAIFVTMVHGSSAGLDGRVIRITKSPFAVDVTDVLSSFDQPRALYAGSALWLARINGDIEKRTPSTLVVTDTVNAAASVLDAQPMAADAINLYYTQSGSKVGRIVMSTATIDQTFDVVTGPSRIALIDSSLWVSGAGQIGKYATDGTLQFALDRARGDGSILGDRVASYQGYVVVIAEAGAGSVVAGVTQTVYDLIYLDPATGSVQLRARLGEYTDCVMLGVVDDELLVASTRSYMSPSGGAGAVYEMTAFESVPAGYLGGEATLRVAQISAVVGAGYETEESL